MFKPKILVSLLIAGGLVSPLAHATNGMLPNGYGIKAEGMAGVGYALPQDSLAAAMNPAGMVMVGDRVDFGLLWFKPVRTTTVQAGGAIPPGTYNGNDKSSFLIPNFGYNKMISSDTSLGVSVFGNGGMNTAYGNNPYQNFNQLALGPGNKGGVAGVNLEQLFISPTWSMKINPTNSVGVSLNIAYQKFSATGIQGFAGFSSIPTAGFNNPGIDTSHGYGLRFGWIGQVTPAISLGATYQTKTHMSKLSQYAGLFADQGAFDIPANFGIGTAIKANSATTVAFDVERIQYSSTNTIGNIFPNGATLGASNGPGFGWKDINVYKLGVNYDYDSSLTLRGGISHCDQPIPGDQVMLNILAPGVERDHLTFGATWKLADKSEISIAYIHAFNASVTGPTPVLPGPTPSQNVTLSMHQDTIGISYGW